MRRRAGTRALAAVLFTDIVDSSAVASRVGDARWNELIVRHHAIVRRELKRYGGKEVDTAGDGFFASFTEPAAAIRCACAASEGVRELGIEIRAGVHFGECEQVGEKLGGIAVVVGARVTSLGGAGDVLVTATTSELVAGAGFGFQDRGDHSLKGVDATWHVLAVTEVDGEPRALPAEPEESERRLAEIQPSSVLSRRWFASRPWAVAVGITLVLALIAVSISLVVAEEPARASFKPGLAIVDQATGESLASIPTSMIRQPAEVIRAEGSFWVHNLDPNSFVEIDPGTGRALAQIDAPFEDVGAFTVDGDSLWVTGPWVAKIDIGLLREVDRFDLPDRTDGVVVADGSLWVTMPSLDTTLRLDPMTGEVEHRFSHLPGSLALAYGDGSVWAGGWTSPWGGFTGAGGVNRIDPDTNRVTTTDLVLPLDCCPVAAGGGFGWTADPTKGVVYKIDQTGGVTTYTTGAGGSIESYGDGVAWVGNPDVGTVVGIEGLTGARHTFRFEHPVQGVAASSGVLLVSLGPGRAYAEVINGLDGNVARFFGPSGRLASPDPATLFGDFAFWVESATCAKLLNHPDEPSPDGWSLQPEVAATMPDISPDGRTYTFSVRPGFKFSPPSGEPVTAETFRYSIERALSRVVGGPGHYFIWDIEGEGKFRRGEADHISGLRAEGDNLTIVLRGPAPDFLERLSLPFFCPVPTDTPVVPGGVGAYAGYPHRAPLPVPSAGPYHIADHLDGEYTILEPNPNYAGPRPQAFDAIVLREGVDPGLAVGLVEGGTWDGIIHVFDPLLDPTGPVAEKYGVQDETGEALRYYATPAPITGFFAFNASRPPFSDPDVRRAAAIMIDRGALAAIWGHAPADQILPPVMPGFEDRELYAPDGSDFEEARTLMRGRTVTAVMAIPSVNDRYRREAEVVRSNLALIGINVEIEAFADRYSAVREPNAKIDLMGVGHWQPFADPATFLYDLVFFGDSPRTWFPERVERQVVALSELSGAKRRSAAVTLADRLASVEVPVAVDFAGVTPTLLSPSLRCREFPPFGFGVDLAALCPSRA